MRSRFVVLRGHGVTLQTEKPRLVRHSGEWLCKSPERVGVGASAAVAYRNWFKGLTERLVRF